ncbi:MAG TPA: hypothetical protein VFS43_12025 [Polyangiaceae bacterium]|nr:hypothetical protein [Polyangiaceae bacterium]
MAAWKRSGQTAEAYAHGRQMHPSTLRWWASRLARAAGADSLPPQAQAGAEVTFLPLRVVAPTPASPDVPDALHAEVVLPGGRSVRLRGELTLDQFVRLLDALEARPSC